MSKINKAGYLRKGFNFQDSYGLFLCSQWLVKPGDYKTLHFELVPDDSDKMFSLDDIALIDANGKKKLYQAKYKDDPTYKWSFEDLIDQPTTKKKSKPSLLQKWSSSLTDVDNLVYAALVTNARADSRIQACLKGTSIDLVLLKKNEPKVFKELVSQIGSEVALEDFLAQFHFEFGTNNIEQAIKENFRALGVTKSGRQQLELMIKNEASKTHTIELTLDDIRSACEFDKPRPLVEDILLPEDFQIFDKSVHQKLLADTKSPKGGVRIIFGKPGAGKSTYLSYLSEELEGKKKTVVKHHYYLGPDDKDGIQRLDTDRATEALKGQFLNLPEKMLGETSTKNPSQVPLRDYIEEVAKYHESKGTSFTLIIDGLDHVIRQKDNEELTKLLEAISYPQKGCRILIGTQESATGLIPLSLLAEAPKKDWIEIKGFSLPTVRKLIKKNITGLRLPEQHELLEELVTSIYSLTQGNPLHLRYTLQQLQNISPDKVVTRFDCEDLIAYSGNIEDYYTALWSKLTEGSKNMLALIAGADFLLKEKWFTEITHLDQSYFEPKSITADYAAIQHLLLRSKREYLSIYHNSFLEFVLKSSEYSKISKPLTELTLKWLNVSNNDALKWSETRKLEYHLGNKSAITDIDHSWLVQAISKPRDNRAIVKQLSLALLAAFEEGNYAKAFQFHALRIYFENAIEFNDDLGEKLWVEAFKAHKPNLTLNDIENYNFSNLSSNQLVQIARWADESGEPDIVEAVYDAIADMHPISTSPKSENNGIPTVAASLVRCIPHTAFNDIARVYRYVKQFRKHEWSEDLFAIYAEELVLTNRSWALKDLLLCDLTELERSAIIQTCTWLALTHQNDKELHKALAEADEPVALGSRLLALLQGRESIKDLPKLPERSELPATVKEHDFEGRAPRKDFLLNVFIKGTFHGHNSSKEGKEFSLGETDWLGEVIQALFGWGYKYGEALRDKKTHLPSSGLSLLSSIEPLKWLGNRDTTYEFWVAFSNSLEPVMGLILQTNLFLDQDFRISTKEYTAIAKGKHFESRKLLDIISDIGFEILDNGAHKKLNADIIDGLDTKLETFPERTEYYLKLTRLARTHSKTSELEYMLELSARNFLGYGYHKDMFLGSTMDCIEVAIKAGIDPGVVKGWIARLAPIVENVPDFTDGDETRHFPSALQEILVLHNSQMANSYYLSMVDKEEYYTAQTIFGTITKHITLGNPITQGILATATDEISQKELIERAKTDKDARKVLDEMESYFGGISIKDERSGYSDPTLDTNDYSKLKPSDFKHESIPGKDVWEKERYIAGWLDFWLLKQEKEAYLAVKTAYPTSILKLRGSILDRLYLLAYKYDDRLLAFEVLCAANKENHGWDVYWTDRQSTINRWDFLKKHYPKRYKEFLVKTLSSDAGKTVAVPIPRVVEFLAHFGDIKDVEGITEQAVIFAENLMANIKLPVSAWVSKEIDDTELLLERFKQPSPITRERVATAIAKIIGESKTDDLLKRLISWTSSQALESDVLLGVMTLEKASREYGLSIRRKVLKSSIPKIPIRSIVVFELLSKLNEREKLGLILLKDVPDLKMPPASYSTGEFFTKYSTGFLSPVHMDRANEIARKTLRPFVRYWSYNALEIMKSLKIDEAVNGVDYFSGSQYQPKRVACSFRISEVYRSAYLRTLHYFYDQGLIPEEVYIEYSFATLPIDFSYWKIQPTRVPEWWPKYEGKLEDISSIHKSFAQSLVNRSKTTSPLFATGAVQPKSWDHGSEKIGIELHAFGYKLLSARRTTDAEIAKLVMQSAPLLMQFPGSPHMEEVLDDLVIPLSLNDEEECEEFQIYPLVGRLHPLSISTWQWFRASHHNLAPIPNLLLPNSPPIIETKLNMLEHGYEHIADGKSIGEYQEWTEGVRELIEDEAVSPFGSHYYMSSDHINGFFKANGFRFGHAYKISVQLGDSYKPDTKVYYGLIGVSGIII